MKIYIICAVFLLSSTFVKVQKLIYVSRIRHFEIKPETDAVKVLNITIFHNKMQDIAAGSIEVIRNIHLKKAVAFVYRCSFEISDCENFQKWKFDDKTLSSVTTMKNQLWSPFFENVTPKLDLPIIKKNIYKHSGGNFDANAVLLFYPEAIKYYWKTNLTLIDVFDRRVADFLIEAAFYTFVERDRKRKGRFERKNLE